jgi:hypothetical protein
MLIRFYPQSPRLERITIPSSKNKKAAIGMSSFSGYKGIRNAPLAVSPTVNAFKPIQDPCQIKTPMKVIKDARVIKRAISFILGEK